MDPLPPIPIPPALRWREFRIRILPGLFFLAALGGVWFIWQNNISAPTLVGAVQTRSAQVICPYPGKITELNVSSFQTVVKGTPLAVITPNDPRAALDVIQADLDILNTKLGPKLTAQRNQTSYGQLRIDWLNQKVELATARVNLERAQNDLKRAEALHTEKLISDESYEFTLAEAQALAAEVSERSNLIKVTESSLAHPEAADALLLSSEINDSLNKALQVEEEKLKTAIAGTEPVILTAPMDGMVNIIYRQAGENISDGDLIMTISAVEPEHIISYLRQPIPFEPKVGLQLQVRTRDMRIQSGVARIERVGSQFEPITNSLAIIRPGTPVDLGLPVEISLPPDLKLRPGEIVDLTLMSQN